MASLNAEALHEYNTECIVPGTYLTLFHIISLSEFALFLNHSPISGKHTVIIMSCNHEILSLASIGSSINLSQGFH